MTEPQIKTVQCLSPGGLHRMAYKEWGDADNPKVLVCVHGVTRVSDDFDTMARALCQSYRVICPDVVGRGRSERLRYPQHYQIGQYVSDMVTLLARITAQSAVTAVNWFGTSMGGLIGIGMASLPDSPIGKLILNDVGPALNRDALLRIGDYIGQAVQFQTFDEAARYIREISATFGPHSDDQWRKMASDVLRQDQNGLWIRHYDLGLAEAFKSATPESLKIAEALLWTAYDAIRCPVLLVRGADSDLLSHQTAQAMTQRGPKAGLIELPGIGHAPTFMDVDQIKIVQDFLLA